MEKSHACEEKPFRKILPPACPPTHFTMEDARRAVLEVMEEDRQATVANVEGQTTIRRGAASPRSAVWPEENIE